jgi:hypothetical protein
MDRKAFLAIVLSLAVLLLYPLIVSKLYPNANKKVTDKAPIATSAVEQQAQQVPSIKPAEIAPAQPSA